jgi:hypothetical protein
MEDVLSTTLPTIQKSDSHHRSRAVRIEAHRATVPVLIASAGENAARRFLELFAATIRNKNTRAAYYGAVTRFFARCEYDVHLDDLSDIEPLHVAAYIEGLQNTYENPSVKQHQTGIRMCLGDRKIRAILGNSDHDHARKTNYP